MTDNQYEMIDFDAWDSFYTDAVLNSGYSHTAFTFTMGIDPPIELGKPYIITKDGEPLSAEEVIARLRRLEQLEVGDNDD